jgi:hypothetical protein
MDVFRKTADAVLVFFLLCSFLGGSATAIDLNSANVDIQAVSVNNTTTDSIPTGSELEVTGVTNRNPDNTAILVEFRAVNGERTRFANDESWGTDGVWRAVINLTDVPPGEYRIEATDGNEVDIRRIQVVPANIDQTPTPVVTTPGSTIEPAQTASSPEPTAVPSPTPSSTSSPTPAPTTSIGTSGFEAIITILSAGIICILLQYRCG